MSDVWSEAPARPSPTWSGRRSATSFVAAPYVYPGTRSEGSYAVADGVVWGLDPVDGGWVDRDARERIDLSGRVLVLAYGSNADPAKLARNLTGTVFALRCVVRDHAAVWCDARRRADSAVVATIAHDPGRVESHHLLAVTPAQLEEMDRWEGAPAWYRRERFEGALVLESGTVPGEVFVYVGTMERRPPLLVDGALLRVADHPHGHVDPLVAR